MKRIIVLDPIAPARLEQLRAHALPGFSISAATSREPQAQLAAVSEADFVISGDAPVTAEMMRAGAAARLKGVQKWGVGYDNIDLETAREVGVRVMRTTGSNAVAVAESTIGLILSVQRSIGAGHAGMLRGEWLKGELGRRTFLLSGKTVGLVGLGFIGKTVAKLLSGFGCRILYVKPTRLDPEEEAALGVEPATLRDLLGASDVVSLHCTLNQQTRGVIDREAITAMKDGAILVNTARGGLVDEEALAEALETGKLRGAALDVFETEPLPPGARLVSLPNVVTTPHIGAQAADNFSKTVGRMFENIRHVADGKEPPELDVLV